VDQEVYSSPALSDRGFWLRQEFAANAFALPKLRELGWTVVEARASQDPQSRLRDELLKLPGARRSKGGKSRRLREMIEEAAKHAPDRLLIVLDQFEEFAGDAGTTAGIRRLHRGPSIAPGTKSCCPAGTAQ